MAYNIQQVNQNTLQGASQVDPPEIVQIPQLEKTSGGMSEIKMVNSDKKYIVAVDSKKIVKLGYCCENAGIIYPIFLKVNGTYKPFMPSKEGIYEIQPETFSDINNEDEEPITISPIITSVMVPADIKFVLDFATSTT